MREISGEVCGRRYQAYTLAIPGGACVDPTSAMVSICRCSGIRTGQQVSGCLEGKWDGMILHLWPSETLHYGRRRITGPRDALLQACRGDEN